MTVELPPGWQEQVIKEQAELIEYYVEAATRELYDRKTVEAELDEYRVLWKETYADRAKAEAALAEANRAAQEMMLSTADADRRYRDLRDKLDAFADELYHRPMKVSRALTPGGALDVAMRIDEILGEREEEIDE
jgi:multidrug efflux pump subunit AcrA (membrane-fusion protein)